MMNEEQLEETITHFTDAFASHGRMPKARIRRWIQQFDGDESLAAKILHQIDYIDTETLDGLVRGMSQRVERHASCPSNQIFFVPTKGPGSGSHLVARALRRLKYTDGKEWRIIDPIDLSDLQPDQVGLVALLDDFSGSGGTLKKNWESSFETLVRPLTDNFCAAVLILHPNADARLADVFSDVIEARMLTESDNILSDSNETFDPKEKERIKYFNEATGAGTRYICGFDDCGLLLAFSHGCPNNSLPLLWYDRHGWQSLFDRRA